MCRLGRLVILGAFALALVAGSGVAGAQNSQPATDVCKLLRAREVAKTLGQPVNAGTPSARELAENGGSEDRCTWETTAPDTGFLGGTRLQLVVSVQSNCARPDAKGCFKSSKQAHQSKHEEKDLKRIRRHEAFYVFTGEVEVMVGERILNVHFNYFDKNMFGRREFERRTVDAAKKAVPRL